MTQPETNRRQESIRIRMFTAEKQNMQRLAALRGFDQSEYVRTLIREDEKRQGEENRTK